MDILKRLNIRFYFVVLLALGLFFGNLNAQTSSDSIMHALEDSLKNYFNALKLQKNDQELLELNSKIKDTLCKALELENSFDYPFGSLKLLTKLKSEDDVFRIFNWNLVFQDGHFEYYGFIQYYDTFSEKYKLKELTDSSEQICSPENLSMNTDHWYGALYYDIIEQKGINGTFYTLLGWDGHDIYSNKKVIDVLDFSVTGQPVFGKSVFVVGKECRKRIIFEFSEQVNMTLKYSNKHDMIFFDHLVPIKATYSGKPKFYGPDGSFDGFKFEDNRWHYTPKITIFDPSKRDLKKNKKKKEKEISLTF